MGIKVLSLFDGISCGRIALERAKLKIDGYYASEIDLNAIEISKKNYSTIKRLGDVTKLTNEEVDKLGEIDLILAGSPCQGFSNSGKRLNFDDPRSKLFFEFVRILNHVKKKNHNVKFLLENVSMKKEWEKIISEHLGVDGIKVCSERISAQRRHRVYWSNIKDFTEGIENSNLTLDDIIEKVEIADPIIKNGIKFDGSFSEASMDLCQMVNGELRVKQATKVGYKVATNNSCINLAFPGCSNRRGRVVANNKSATIDTVCNFGIYTNGVVRRFTMAELEKLQTLPVGYTEGVNAAARKKAIGNGWTVDVITHFMKKLKEELGNE